MDLEEKVKDAEKNKEELEYIRETFDIINSTLKDKQIQSDQLKTILKFVKETSESLNDVKKV